MLLQPPRLQREKRRAHPAANMCKPIHPSPPLFTPPNKSSPSPTSSHPLELTSLIHQPRHRPQRIKSLHRLLMLQRRRGRTPIRIHLQPHEKISSLHASNYEPQIPNGRVHGGESGPGAVQSLDFGRALECHMEASRYS